MPFLSEKHMFQDQMPFPVSVSNKEHSMLLDSDSQDAV